MTLVNQEVLRVPDGGSVALCQAIPAVAVAPVLHRRAPAAVQVNVGVRAPDGTRAVRRVTLRGKRRAVAFSPAAFGDDAFREGVYRVRASARGRVVARGAMRFRGTGTC